MSVDKETLKEYKRVVSDRFKSKSMPKTKLKSTGRITIKTKQETKSAKPIQHKVPNNSPVKTPFPSFYEEFIYKSRYSRYLPEESRREEWHETVNRYLDFMTSKVEKDHGVKVDPSTRSRVYNAIYNLQVMPSMRAMMTAGPALERSNVAGYNCSYLPVDDPKSFDEAMYILMCGTGVGFSVEQKFTSKLPEIPETLYPSETTVVVRDSKEGWSKAYRQLIALLYSGEVPKWDVKRVRPAGERLKTFGGRASGPEPLEELFRFTVEKFRGAVGRKLRPIECHDILCKIGEIVVVGGVRRSAMISLSDIGDSLLANAKNSAFKIDEYKLVDVSEDGFKTYAITMKKGQPVSPTYTVTLHEDDDNFEIKTLEQEKTIGWWRIEPQRALANNSALYEEKPSVGLFLGEWKALYDSKSGERGIFNRDSARNQAKRNGRRNVEGIDFGTNPCSEIILRPYQFC